MKKWGLIGSLGCLVLLTLQPSLVGILISGVAFAALWGSGVHHALEEAFPVAGRKRTAALVCAAEIPLVLFFCLRWVPSGIVRQVAGLLGVDHRFLLVGGAVVLAAGAFPWMHRAARMLICRNRQNGKHLTQIESALNGKGFLGSCVALFAACLAVLLYFTNSKSAWIDEAFTQRMIGYSYAEIVEMCSIDVHVPLYYFIAKTIVDVLKAVFPAVPAIYFAKFASIVPYILMGVLALTWIRKRWGNYAAGLFCVCIVGMPQMMQHGVDIRMYSWAMLFLLMAFLSADGIIRTHRKKFWVLLILFSWAAAYTHHYALIAVAALWFFLLIWHVADRELTLRPWLVCAAVTIAGYLPWLMILMGQLKYVSNSYWIQPITLNTVLEYFRYLFGDIWMVLLVAAAVVMALRAALRQHNKESGIAATGTLIAPLVMLAGIVVSFLFKPVFVARYLLPGVACLWLGVLALYAQQKNTLAKYLAALLMITMTAGNVQMFCRSEQTDKQNAAALHDALAPYQGWTVVATDDFVNREIAVITNNDGYLWSGEAEYLMKTVYGNIYDLNEDADQLHQWLEEGKQILLVTMTDEQTLQNELEEKHGFTLKPAGEYTAGAKGVVQNIALFELTAS